jgi:hypothetical protein
LTSGLTVRRPLDDCQKENKLKVYVVKCSCEHRYGDDADEWYDKPFHLTPESAHRKIEKLKLAKRSPYESYKYSVGEVDVVEEE